MSDIKTTITFNGKRLNSTEALAKAIQDKIKEKAAKAHLAVAQRIAHEVWENTPVVTGNTKSNWHVVSGNVPVSWDKEAVGHQPVKFNISAPSGLLRIINTAPAAYFVELRSGFVRTTMMDYKMLVDEAVKDLKGKK